MNYDVPIKIYYNVLSEHERINLLESSKLKLYDLGDGFPGLQTDTNFHLCIEKNTLNKICEKINNNNIDSCWVNYTDHSMKYQYWHNHENVKDTCVYMIENPEKIGTIFKINEEEYQMDLPTNSLITFPPDLMHTVPYNVINPRYSLAIDFI